MANYFHSRKLRNNGFMGMRVENSMDTRRIDGCTRFIAFTLLNISSMQVGCECWIHKAKKAPLNVLLLEGIHVASYS